MGPKHKLQPQNRLMAPSQGLPTKIDHQVQPMDRGSKTARARSCSAPAASQQPPPSASLVGDARKASVEKRSKEQWGRFGYVRGRSPEKGE